MIEQTNNNDMKQHNKVGIYATLASICLALIAATIFAVLPDIKDSVTHVASIFGLIMAAGLSAMSAIIAIMAFLDR